MTIEAPTLNRTPNGMLIEDLFKALAKLHRKLMEFDDGRGILPLDFVDVVDPNPRKPWLKRLFRSAVPAVYEPTRTKRIKVLKVYQVPYYGQPTMLYMDLQTGDAYAAQHFLTPYPKRLEPTELADLPTDEVLDLLNVLKRDGTALLQVLNKMH